MHLNYYASAKNNSSYIPGIDGLRAIAVLSVIIFHLRSNLLPGGFTGVDIFFVISGYVVSRSLAKEKLCNFWKFTLTFYARRILRIYPALLVCLVVVAIFQSLFVPSSWLSTTTNKTALSAFFGLSNFALVLLNDGYFSPRVEFNAFTHTWSLAVEEQFYLLFPLVFYIWLKWRERKGLVGVISNSLLFILFSISLCFSWCQTSAAPDYAYYLLPSRFWELATGGILFKLHSKNQFLPKTEKSQVISLLFVLLLIGIALIFSDPKLFPFPWAIVSVTGSVFVIVGVAHHVPRVHFFHKTIENKIIVYIGKVSYSLYLWHWPVIVMFRWTTGLDSPSAIFVAIIITILLGVVSYQYIEQPIRHKKIILSKPDWFIVSRGVLIIFACTVISAGILKSQSLISLSITKDKKNWYPEAWKNEVSNDNNLPLSNHNIFVLGDSHTGAYSTMLQMLREEHGVKVQQMSKAGCAVANLLAEASHDCAQFIIQAIAKIKTESSPGDIVFLASLRMNRLGDQWATFDETLVTSNQTNPLAVSRRTKALQEANLIIEDIESAGLTVIIDAPKPIFKSPAFRCSDWFNSINPVCKGGLSIDRSILENHRRPIMESIQILKKNHPNLVIWDSFYILCPNKICMTFDHELPIFFDGDHLSGHGNRMLYPSFSSFIKKVFNKKT